MFQEECKVFGIALPLRKWLIGVNGWVKNLPDGRVEVMICGSVDAANALKDWLWEGPVAADVKDVVVVEETCQYFSSFDVL